MIAKQLRQLSSSIGRILVGLVAFWGGMTVVHAEFAFVQTMALGSEYDLAFSGDNLFVNVPAGYATGQALVFVWDEEDRGKQLVDWPNRQVLMSSVPAAGVRFMCPISAIAMDEGARAMRVFTADELVLLDRLQMSGGKCYINTKVKDNNCSRVAFSFYQTGQTGSWAGVIGTSGEDSFAVGMNNAAVNSWCWWYRTKHNDRPTVLTDRPNVVDFNNGTFYLNGSAFATGLGTPVGLKNRDIYVGTSTVIPDRQAYGWWYYVQMWDLNGEPLIDYVPAKRVADGAVGFYDRVSGQLIVSDAGGVFTPGEEQSTFEYVGDSESSPVFLDPGVIQTAVWTAAGDPTDLSNSANWICTNFFGDEVPGALPQHGITAVSISGQVGFSCPDADALPWGRATFGNCTLTAAADWSGLGDYSAWLATGALVNLAGHALTVVGPVARESNAVTFTSGSAQPGELHLVVPSGYAVYPQLVLSGNLRLVKEGAGTLVLAREDFTGGTTVAGGVLGKTGTAQAAGDEPTFEQMSATGTVKMFVPPGWRTGQALFIVSDATAKGVDPFAWSARSLMVSVLPNLGAEFEFEPTSLGLLPERPFYLLTATEYGLTDRLKMTSTGTWIDTGFNDKQCTRVEFAFYQDGGYSGDAWGGGLIGSLNESSFALSMSNGSRTIWCWWYKGKKQGDRPTVSETEPNIVDFDNGTFHINGQTLATDLGTPVGTNNSRLYIGRGSSTSRYCFGWWYYVRFWNGGTKLLDYLPAKREYDGKACFYDQVSKKPVFSSGAGDFTSGSMVTNRFYLAGQLDRPRVLDAATAAKADWIGAGDPANLSDARNWTCRNLFGTVVPEALPNRTCTVATIQDEASFECPLGSEELWLNLQVGTCLLTRAHDWRGAKLLQVNGTMNLSGQTLAVSVLAGSGTILGSGTVRIDVPQGTTQVNDSLEIGGAVQLIKEGAGTYQPKKQQTYTGGTLVNAGTLSLPAAGGSQTTYSPLHTTLLGPQGSSLVVEAGATFDCGGNYDLNLYRTVLHGGTYANFGGNQENFASWGCNGNITLTDNSFFKINVGMALTDGVLDLGGKELTVTIGNGSHFQLRSGCEFKNGKMVLTATTGMFCLYTDEVVAPTLDLDIACNTEIKKPLTVHDYTMRRQGSWGWSSAVTKVLGRFLPLTDHFTSVELQSGAVLDLSTQTGVWSTQSLDINNVNNGGAFHYVCTFADEAAITVDLSGRHFTQGEQIVSWEEVPENLDSLKFKPDEVSRLRYALQKRNEGLFAVSSSLVIYVR